MSLQKLNEGNVLTRHDSRVGSQVRLRPDKKEIEATAERTKLALDAIIGKQVRLSQPTQSVVQNGGQSQANVYRFTNADNKQRLVRVNNIAEDPLEPPRHKAKKIPRANTEEPAPILRSPPKKITPEEQREWMIPPCVSNWKNNKGYTVPLDKRLAADGRGLKEHVVNDKFVQFAEALYVADNHAREEVKQRALIQERLAQKEKEAKEARLRELALQARQEQATQVISSGLSGYNDDEDDEDDAETRNDNIKEAQIRDHDRQRRKEIRLRDARLARMKPEDRARVIAKLEGRDVSEKVKFGLASSFRSGGADNSDDIMHDPRLYNRESYGSFADEDAYSLYDKPLFEGSTTASMLHANRSRHRTGANHEDDDDDDDILDPNKLEESLTNDRFGLISGRQPEPVSAPKTERDSITASGAQLEIEDAPMRKESNAVNTGNDNEIDAAVDDFLKRTLPNR